MSDDQGESVSEALPSTPVEVTGWKSLPEAGDVVIGSETEDIAKKVVNSRIRKAQQIQRLDELSALNNQRMKKFSLGEEIENDTSNKPSLTLVIKGNTCIITIFKIS